ncbi:MAG: GlsB/YeaQ/YmgE family stress response membrane protein [Acidimicrobiales bacterium]
MFLLIIGLLFSGLIIGALGRLVVPGRNPIGLLGTIGAGIAGSFFCGLVARFALKEGYGVSGLVGFVLAVMFTALIVKALSPRASRALR